MLQLLAREVAPATDMSTTVGDMQATLAQCHFHWVSEHTVDGSPRPLCVHCVHAKADQTQAIPQPKSSYLSRLSQGVHDMQVREWGNRALAIGL